MSPIEEDLVCPIHGAVDGLSLNEGPLSETHPWAVVCEDCGDEGDFTVVVGWELDGHGTRRRWQDFGSALV